MLISDIHLLITRSPLLIAWSPFPTTLFPIRCVFRLMYLNGSGRFLLLFLPPPLFYKAAFVIIYYVFGCNGERERDVLSVSCLCMSKVMQMLKTMAYCYSHCANYERDTFKEMISYQGCLFVFLHFFCNFSKSTPSLAERPPRALLALSPPDASPLSILYTNT